MLTSPILIPDPVRVRNEIISCSPFWLACQIACAQSNAFLSSTPDSTWTSYWKNGGCESLVVVTAICAEQRHPRSVCPYVVDDNAGRKSAIMVS